MSDSPNNTSSRASRDFAELDPKSLRATFHYSPENGTFTRRSTGKVAGCKASHGYLVIRFGEKLRYAHRLAWLYVHGVWPTNVIDHINGDKTDNRLANLRDVTTAANAKNRPKSRFFLPTVPNSRLSPTALSDAPDCAALSLMGAA